MYISTKILNWYQPDHRALPWRETTDPYAIWVSEIMLQQTQAKTVIPYFNRFIEAFPTTKDLAEADEDKVFKLWQGLGYYSRAKNLLKAAKIVSREGMPKNFDSLKTLPGIGDYTAAAIASIAYREPVAAVDGNMLRIYSRLYRIEEPIDKAKTKRHIFELASKDISKTRPGDFNQAIMDLGNQLCTPTKPMCLLCPLKEDCLAYKAGVADTLPYKTPKKKQRSENYTLLLMKLGDKYRIEKRKNGLLKDLWGFPLLPGHLMREDLLKYLAENDIFAKNILPIKRYRHIFTHKKWEISVVYIPIEEIFSQEEAETWANIKELKDIYAIPSAFMPALEVIDALD